jgi:hypothetical protein
VRPQRIRNPHPPALGFRGATLAPSVLTRALNGTNAGLDAYVLNARVAELGTGVGPQLKLELQLAQQLRTLQAEFAAARAAATAATAAAAAKAAA